MTLIILFLSFCATMFDVCRQYCQVIAEYLPTKVLEQSRIPMWQYFTALDKGAVQHGDPLWGFELGKQVDSAHYGLLGYLVESSSTLFEALDALLMFDKTVADIGVCQFSQANSHGCIVWQPYENNRHAILRNMTGWVAMVRKITGKTLSPHHVELTSHCTDTQLQRLVPWFGCKVSDKAIRNAITFDSEFLNLPILTKNELVNANLYPLIQDLQRAYNSGQSWLAKLQPTLHSCDLQLMSVSQLAHMTGTSARTLQRHLRLHGLSFSKLVEQERKRRFTLFCEVLNKQALSELLGYAEQASLNRAVRRWYGQSPSEYVAKKLQNMR
ncbi:AraC family transcriptional regulator [Pseudoalteromonas sp. MMG022]|uniref:AraC family transcriptional regulator n=1 Tax=Pseudoalteromonas sp. MMG022 TaxID=2909978 RepID=UPI001F1FA84B|nr:AraC family transcriptional regulator [Pseudoalteromonas sp. MMG022]MCF6435906.1 AraC family transcriptional regulator [Pseudoalteromonas sp. MMG022]